MDSQGMQFLGLDVLGGVDLCRVQSVAVIFSRSLSLVRVGGEDRREL
jgi:hypothetical protein